MTTKTAQTQRSAPVSHAAMLRFFLPLAATSFLIVMSHSLINAGIARIQAAEIGLAAYALAKSLVLLLECPVFMVRQTTAALAGDRVSFRLVQKFVYVVTLAVAALILVFAVSPLGQLVFESVFGARPAVAKEAHAAMKILWVLPLVSANRNLFHGVAIVARQTVIVPLTTAGRIFAIVVIVALISSCTTLTGAIGGAIAFVSSFGFETLLMFLFARRLLHDPTLFPRRPSDGQAALSYQHIGRFFAPLVLTTLVGTLFDPVINSGLTRTGPGEKAVAAFAVAMGLAMLFLGPVGMLHQCTLSFFSEEDDKTRRKTCRFSLAFGAVVSIMLAAIGFYRPLGMYIQTQIIGVPLEVAELGQGVLQVCVFIPAVGAWREHIWGVLMKRRMTGLIGQAKLVNLLSMTVFLVAALALGPSNPAAAAASARLVGELADCLFVAYRSRSIWAPDKRLVSA